MALFQRSLLKCLVTLPLALGAMFVTAKAETQPYGPDSDRENVPSVSAPIAQDSCPTEHPKISYVLYSEAVSLRLDADNETRARRVHPGPISNPSPLRLGAKNLELETHRVGFPTPAPPRTSTAPMSAGEKFMLFLSKSFKPVGPYAMSAFSGVVNEAFDKNDGRDSTTGDFFADSATRAARSFAFRTTANFFEKFAYSVAFKQDPRYHRSNKSGVGGKIGYAVSRLFVTQGDRSGDQFNASYILGGMTAAAISNVWQRDENRTVAKSFRRWGVHLGLTAFSNIVREFIGGQ